MRRSPAKTYVDYISGPVKIKDGLFMGDQVAAKDMDFVASNKVTHIINTVVNRVPNLYQRLGIQYLSVNWTERQQNIFDKKNNAVNMIFQFVQQAMEQGESVLVHSINGKSRAGCVILAYLMRKYCWSLQKSIDFITSKKATFKIRNSFLTQLQDLQKRIAQTYNLTNNWNEHKDQQDLVMLNTFKNSKIPVHDKTQTRKGKKKVSWGEKLVTGSTSKVHNQNILTSTAKYKQFLENQGIATLKSILKNDSNHIKESQKYQSIDKKKEPAKIQQQNLAKSQLIGNIKGNVVNVVVNNFIVNNQKPSVRSSSTSGKQISKKLQSRSGSRLAPYENIISSIRSPYDSNFINKVGQNNKYRKKDEQKNTNDRPQSVNLEQTLKQSKVSSNTKPSYKQQLVGYTINKNRYGWVNPRQNNSNIKYK